ncbi:ABC transporter ATP-binding protein [Arthrobacter crystallopoietes]|uniref:ABC transporter ATP-binding protein n=1 Tax=Crystallibacter crystallopoietes TaxID=37928 RepID=UPI003D2602F2
MNLRGVGLEYRAGGTLILDGVDCPVPAGSVTGLLGPNGAGKTSLLQLLAAVAVPHAGTVLLDGASLHALPRKERARRLAFVEQSAATDLPLTVLDVVLLGRMPYRSVLAGTGGEDLHTARRSLEAVGLEDFAGRRYSTLSGGERQRVQLAKALAQEPEVLLLDEPTNHLDVNAQLSTMELVRDLAAGGVGVLAALHDINLAAAYCDRVIVLHQGRVAAAGPTAEVLVPALIRRVYGVEAVVLDHPLTGRPLVAFGPLPEAPASAPSLSDPAHGASSSDPAPRNASADPAPREPSASPAV